MNTTYEGCCFKYILNLEFPRILSVKCIFRLDQRRYHQFGPVLAKTLPPLVCFFARGPRVYFHRKPTVGGEQFFFKKSNQKPLGGHDHVFNKQSSTTKLIKLRMSIYNALKGILIRLILSLMIWTWLMFL